MSEPPAEGVSKGASVWIRTTRTWTGATLPCLAALAVGLVAGRDGVEARANDGGGLFTVGALRAGSPQQLDSDGDGLADAQELVIGSSPYHADTDGDGYLDAEEVARNSRADNAKCTPLPAATGIGMTARGEDGDLRVVISTYLADGNADSCSIQLGMVLNGRLVPLEPSEYLPKATVAQVPTAGGGVVVLIDVPLDPRTVETVGDLSIFSTLVSNTQPTVLGAAAVDLLNRDGVVVLVQEPNEVRPNAVFPGSGSGYGSIYNPIPPGGDGDIPSTWVPGEICYQSSVVVGVANGVMTREVVAADCLEGWEASCRADCSSSVGETFDTFDPLGLVGQ